MKKKQIEQLSDGELSLAILRLKTGGLGDNYRVSKISSTARCLVGTGGNGSITSTFDINSAGDMWDLIVSDGSLDFLLSAIRSARTNEDCAMLRDAAITYLVAHNINGYK